MKPDIHKDLLEYRESISAEKRMGYILWGVRYRGVRRIENGKPCQKKENLRQN
jgi:hypothetical protein